MIAIPSLGGTRIAYVALASWIVDDVKKKTGITSLSLTCPQSQGRVDSIQQSSSSSQPGNALYAASECGREKVVQILVEGGADVNAQGGVYGNALRAASSGGHEKVVQILVDVEADVDVNAQGRKYGNALQAASSGGHEEVVQTLVAAGADVNAKGGKYGNANIRSTIPWLRKGGADAG